MSLSVSLSLALSLSFRPLLSALDGMFYDPVISNGWNDGLLALFYGINNRRPGACKNGKKNLIKELALIKPIW
jgi:hypothetical protein